MKSKLLIINDVPDVDMDTITIEHNNKTLLDFKTYMNDHLHNICDICYTILLNNCIRNSKEFIKKQISEIKEHNVIVIYDCCDKGTPSKAAMYIIKVAEKLDRKVILMDKRLNSILAAIDEIGGFLTLKSGKSDIFKMPSNEKLLAWGLEAIKNSGAIADMHCYYAEDSGNFFTKHLHKHFMED